MYMYTFKIGSCQNTVTVDNESYCNRVPLKKINRLIIYSLLQGLGMSQKMCVYIYTYISLVLTPPFWFKTSPKKSRTVHACFFFHHQGTKDMAVPANFKGARGLRKSLNTVGNHVEIS